MQQHKPLTMVRPNLDDIPTYPLPAPYAIRWFQPGDERHWVSIHLLADQFNQASLTLYHEEFGDNPQLLAERQAFLVDASGTPVGTASAWYSDEGPGGAIGRVHWVAINPDVQGKGLAKPLMTAVCQRLGELGHQSAYLTTSTARPAAINLYLRFGFLPVLQTAAEQAQWERVTQRLAAPRQAASQINTP